MSFERNLVRVSWKLSQFFFFRNKLSRLEHVIFLKVSFASYFRGRLSKENFLMCHYLYWRNLLKEFCVWCTFVVKGILPRLSERQTFTGRTAPGMHALYVCNGMTAVNRWLGWGVVRTLSINLHLMVARSRALSTAATPRTRGFTRERVRVRFWRR